MMTNKNSRISNTNTVMKVLSTKTREEEALIIRLMSMDFKQYVIQYVRDIVTSCGKKMIELEK